MLRWHDLVVLLITYTITGLGITVGYHRLFTHRSFKGRVRCPCAAGRARLDGGRGALDPGAGLARHAPRAGPRAHRLGLSRQGPGRNSARYAKDLLADRDLRFISRTFPLWVLAGLALPFGLGVALTGTIAGGLGGLLWGGSGTRAAPASRDLQHQLAVSRLRPPAVRDGRRVPQPRVARADRVRRGLATQPPRLPHLRASWAWSLAARSQRRAHRRPGALSSGVGRPSGSPRHASKTNATTAVTARRRRRRRRRRLTPGL